MVFAYLIDPTTNLTAWLLVPARTDSVVYDLPAMNADRRNGSDQISISTTSDGVIHTFNWKRTK